MSRLVIPGPRSVPHIVALLALAAAIAACGQKPSGGTEKPAPAAKVQNQKPESDLTTITLSPEAEAHLALQTAEVGRTAVSETRTVGGEAVIVPGRAAVISAPVAGAHRARWPGTGGWRDQEERRALRSDAAAARRS
jgi:hypothetical protein